ncbi:MAG: SH3 domain-containing protein [Acidaminobacteraceae bacterium]
MVVYKVSKSRESDSKTPIKVTLGESVRCIEESDINSDWAGWTLCSTCNNQGWIPSEIIEVSGEVGIIKENYDAVEFDITIDEII